MMNYKIIVFALFYLVTGLFGKSVDISKNIKDNEIVSVENNSRQSRVVKNSEIYAGLFTCAIRYDAWCFVDVAQNYLDTKKRELLAQADEQAARASGDTSIENKPSQIASTVEKLFSDLMGLFRDGFSGIFGKDDDDEDSKSEKTKEVSEDDEDNDDDDDKKEDSSRDVGESRKKKKKIGPIKKIIAAIKVVILAAAVAIKVCILIKIFEAALKLKLVLIGVGSLVIQIVKLWLDYRNNKHEHVETGITYHNPYGNNAGVEWAGPGNGEDLVGRSDSFYAQKLAYKDSIRK